MRIYCAVIALLFLVTGMSFASEVEQTVIFDVEQMTCATCPISVRKAMQRVDGVKSVEVSLEGKSAVVTFNPSATTIVEIGKASTDVGFPATPRDSE